MGDAEYANEANALLAKLVAVDADVHFRSLVVREKCEELERTLRFVQTLHERRAKARDARLEEEKCQDAQTQRMHESIQDAIERARQIRETLAKTSGAAGGSDGSDADDDEKGNDDGALQSILKMAKSIRAQNPPDRNKLAARPPTTASKPSAAPAPGSPLETAPASPQIHIEHPRRMKTLLDQLRDMDEKESHESFRFVFCRKMAEHLSLNSQFARLHVDGRDALMPPSRVQVGYPKQVARLQHGYTLIAEFMTQRVDISSEKFQLALHSPTLSSVFPIYTRVKQGKHMLKSLNEETKALVERTPPPPPRLSVAAAAHRDAMLKRLSTKTPSGSPSSPAAVSNAHLQSLSHGTAMDSHRSTLERLQAAWDASQTSASGNTMSSNSVFESTLQEIVLADTSNIILSFFKTIFCDNPDDPEPVHVKNMLLLIRLVDSITMTNGRRLRSAVSSIPT